MNRDRIDNLEEQKRKIIGFIEVNGPTIPVKISSFLKLDTMLASAFLADLVEEGQLRFSCLRVGNSPVYYIRGQEFQLEKYSNFLSGKEKEAFEMLRERKVLEDENIPPAIRVALRSIKDFAFPIKHQDSLYWRFLKLSDQQAVDIIESGAVEKVMQRHTPRPISIIAPIIEEKIESRPELVQRGIETSYQNDVIVSQKGIEVEKPKTEFIEVKTHERHEPKIKFKDSESEKIKLLEKELKQVSEEIKRMRESKLEAGKKEKPLLEIKKPIKKEKVKEKSEFVLDVLNFLEKNDFIIDKEIDFKKKEFIGSIKIDSQLGKVNALCFAKDKKSITEADLNIALQKSHEYRMSVMLISPGELNKKASGKLQELGNLVFYKQMK